MNPSHNFGGCLFTVNPLAALATCGLVALLRLFLCHFYQNPEEMRTDIRAAFIASARTGCVRVMKLMVEFKANVNIPENAGGDTALIISARRGHNRATRFLVAQGADPNYVRNDGSTALFLSSREGRENAVQILIESGANVNQVRQDYGWTSLTVASILGHCSICSLLLQGGALVDHASADNEETSLFKASLWGRVDIVKLMIDFRANVNHVNKSNKTPLHMASLGGHFQTVGVLLDLGGATVDDSALDLDVSENALIIQVLWICFMPRYIGYFEDIVNTKPHLRRAVGLAREVEEFLIAEKRVVLEHVDNQMGVTVTHVCTLVYSYAQTNRLIAISEHLANPTELASG